MTELKDKAVLAMVGTLVLYAVAVATWFVHAEDAWKKAAKGYEREVDRFEKEERLISERRKWNDLYETEKAAMPTFKADMATDTTWLRKVEDLAKASHFFVGSIEPGKESEAGEVLELPLELKNCECSLEGLVKFMHALENAEDGMFDIKAIGMKPITGKLGYLKVSLSITCAYMRGD